MPQLYSCPTNYGHRVGTPNGSYHGGMGTPDLKLEEAIGE
jgi:hypothetical protein